MPFKMMKLVTVKPHRYETRNLQAGDEYEAPMRFAAAMVASRKARFAAKDGGIKNKSSEPAAVLTAPATPSIAARVATPVTPPIAKPVEPVEPVEPVVEIRAEVDVLRDKLKELGVEVDKRWGVQRLQYELGQAKR